MSIITIILFFIYSWGLGFTAMHFVKKSENFLERNLMRIGVGLGTFPILSILLNFLHVPLDWKIFLVLSFAFPVYYAIKNKKFSIQKPSFRLTKSNLIILVVLLLFFATLYMYSSGAFAYPWLENSDPYAHAEGVKYVAIEKKAFTPFPGVKTFHYIDPYPPSYDIMMGVLHQTSPSMMWTLKFFNSLILSLGIIFFYFFVKKFTGSRNKALFSTFVLAMIPCYLSHFIWAHALIITLLFPTFYALENIKNDKKWTCIALLLVASLMVIQPTQQVKIVIMLAGYWIIKIIAEKKFLKGIFIAGIGGLLLSLLLWWGPMLIKYNFNVLGVMTGGSSTGISLGEVAEKGYIGILGTGTRLYTFNDFFIAKPQNMINNPIGVGVILCILLAISLIYVFVKYKKSFSKEKVWIPITLFWLIFAFLGIHGGTRIPIALVSFRFWMLFAIPLSILVSEGMFFIFDFCKKVKISVILVLVIIIVGIFATSGYQKYALNTAQWPFGGSWSSMEEFQTYVWLKTLQVNTKVFTFSGREEFLIAFDKFICKWCPDLIEFRKVAANKTPEELYSWLKVKDYEYLIIDSSFAKEYGENETNEKIRELISSNLFSVTKQTESAIVFNVI